MSFDLEDIVVEDLPIENQIPEKWILITVATEVGRFAIIFVAVFMLWVIFLNGQLIFQIIDELFTEQNSMAANLQVMTPEKSITVKNIEHKENQVLWDNFANLKKEVLDDILEKRLNSVKTLEKQDIIYKPSYDSFMKNRVDDYNLKFNLLPPDNRLIINKIWVNVHIVDVKKASSEKIRNAEFDEELFKGVVKYPYTPSPDQAGNVFIFGHTSYYWWKENPYGTIFSKLPQMKKWDNMKLVWWGIEYEYEIIEKAVRSPWAVDEYYKKYDNGDYLTLMGCYPIWSDAKRLLVVAKKIK